MAFHPHVLTSPDRATVVEESLHFISNRMMVTSADMQATNKMDSTPQNSVVAQDGHVWDAEALLRQWKHFSRVGWRESHAEHLHDRENLYQHWNDDSQAPCLRIRLPRRLRCPRQ